MVLSFQNITHEIGGNLLFQDVGFSLEDGCLLIVKGPNGCGKTTLLKILAGLMLPKYGFIFAGLDEEAYEISEDYRKYFASMQFVGHQNSLDADLTVLENLRFWAKISDKKLVSSRAKSRDLKIPPLPTVGRDDAIEMSDAVDAVIKFFNLTKYTNTPCKYLSAGWQRRVALSKLMLTKSKIWILDEPFSNLDAEMIDMTLKMIASFCDQGGKIIMSCHQEVNLPFGMEMQLTDFAAAPSIDD